MRYAYGFDWIPGGVFLGTVLLLLIVPPFALIALAVVAVAAVAALVALTGAVLATPYLLVRSVRRRLSARHMRQPQPQSQPQALPAAESVVAT
jgi:hypothetical protein